MSAGFPAPQNEVIDLTGNVIAADDFIVDGQSIAGAAIDVADIEEAIVEINTEIGDIQTELENKLSTTDNAATSSKWQTPRTLVLNGDVTGFVEIDGSADSTLVTVVQDNSHGHTIENVDGLQASLDDKLGVSENAVSASVWETPRTVTLGGDLTGNVSLDGSTDVTLTATVADDSHNHIISNVDGLQTALDGKLGVSDNAVSASVWETPRTLTLGGDLTGNVSIDGSSNVTLTASVVDDSHNHTIENIDGLQATLDGIISASAAFSFQGFIDCSGNPDYPAADSGHVYRVSVAGKIGGASGTDVDVNDVITCIVNGSLGGTQAAVGTDWVITQENVDGAVVGPVSSTDGHFARFSGTSGGIIADDGPLVAADITDSGATGRSVLQAASSATARTAIGAAATTHSHVISDVTGLQTALDGKLASGSAAVSADKLTTSRTITLAGDVTGSVSFDGSANVSITSTVVDDSHNHIISNVDGLQTAMDLKAPLASPDLDQPTFTRARALASSTDLNSVTTAGFYTVAIPGNRPVPGAAGFWYVNVYRHSGSDDYVLQEATPLTSDSPAEERWMRTCLDGVWQPWGLMSAVGHSHVISDTTGLQTALDSKLGVSSAAVTANKLTTPRTISLGGDVTGSVAFDGSANVTITSTVADDSHNHVIGNVDNLQSTLDLKAPLSSPNLDAPTFNRARALAASTNLDTVTTAGFYTVAIPANRPVSGTDGFWYVNVYRHSGSDDFVIQEAFPMNSADGVNPSANRWIRSRFSGVWQPWARMAVSTYQTTAEFEAAAPVSGNTNVVQVLGELEAGDGNEYTLKRGTTTAPANGTGRKQTLSPIWWQLVKHDRLNSGNFNIRGNGSYDDNDGVTDAIRAAAEYGSLLTFRPVPDKYMIGALDINLSGLTSKSLRIEAHGALFYAHPVATVAETQAMIDIDGGVNDPYTRPDLIWKGGKFNAEGLPYGDPDETTPWRHRSFGARGGCISIRRWNTATFEDMILKGGTAAFDPNGLFAQPGYVAGDQGIASLSVKTLNLNRVGGIGLPDALVYPRANADMSVPDYESTEGVTNITDCWVRDCYQGVYGKFAGGQVNVRNFTSLRTWRPVNLLATYVPQIDNAGVQEPGTGYQPYSGSVIGLRARQTYEFPVLVERAQNFIVQGLDVVDWGRRPNGVASIVNGRRLAPVVYLAGCRNGVVSGVAARVRDWNGGTTTEIGLNGAFLNGVYVEDHTHTAWEDPVGGGTRPENTIASEAIKISDVTLWGDPVTVVSVPYVGSTNGRVDWIGQDVTSNSIRGIGSIVIVKGSASQSIDISGCHAYHMHGTGQEYVFDADTEQWIDGMLVPSPSGDGYAPGAEFRLSRTIASGVINIPPKLRANYITVTVDTQGEAASDDLDTISGSFDGQTIVLRRAVSGRSVVLKAGVGNFAFGTDITLSAAAHLVVLNRRGNSWFLVSSTV